MQRKFFFFYGLACYGLFLVVYLYMACFVGNISFGVLKTIDSPREGSITTAIIINTLLIAIFGAQHSVMARPTFKKWWIKYCPEPIERSTYVLFSCIAIVVLMVLWQPIGGTVWDVQNTAGRYVLYSLFALGWLMVPAVTFLLNHFDLFGTRQVWLHMKGEPYTQLKLTAPIAYKFVRHPLYVGWAIAFWATPTMTVAHLVFAVLLTAYMLIAIPFEERNLIDLHGQAYADYRKRTPALIPGLKLTKSS